MAPQEDLLSSTIVFRMVAGIWAATLHSKRGFVTVEAFTLDDALTCLLEAAPTTAEPRVDAFA